jgi:SAM-dependent methyltransferase
MRMNRLGRWIINSPQRVLLQRCYVLPVFYRLGCSVRGRDVLEVGCGRGIGIDLSRREGAHRVDGVDLDPVMAALAQRRLGSRALVAVADIAALPMSDATYDLVIDFGALHLMPDWRAGLGQVARVLRPRGQFAFELPAHRCYRMLMPVTTGRRIGGGLSGDTFLAELDEHGLRLLALRRSRMLALSVVVGDGLGLAVKHDGGSP